MHYRVAAGRILAVTALLVAAAFVGGCSSSPKDSCYDVSISICEALDECGRIGRTFASTDQCVASFSGLWEVGNREDAECREEWSLVEDMTCDQLATYFQL